MSRLSVVSRVLTLALVLAAVAGCAPAPMSAPAAAMPTQAPASLKVLAAETFLADIAQNVAGNRLKVEALMPIGVDPHAFEPTPGDVALVAKSNVLIVNGAGFEGFLDKLLSNAGGQRTVIKAAAGLESRQAREGEVAEMSDADLADAMCAAAGEEKLQPASAGKEAAFAAELPGESGFFQVKLTQQPDGAFTGYLTYATHVAGDLQIALGAGKVTVSKAQDKAEVEIKKTLPLAQPSAGKCAGLNQGNIVELKDGEYILTLTGFKTDTALLLIGPAGGRRHYEGDPHFWLDPTLVVKYVENIRDGLSQADPDGSKTYAANAEAYIKQLQELDKWIAEQVKGVPDKNRQLVTNHESLGYFADRYGFQVVGTIVPSVSTSASPSAQQLARLSNAVKKAGVKAIFLETGSSSQLAKQLAQEAGVKVVTELYTHSITDAKGAAPTYIDMMKYNVKTMVEALK
jgi:manganese/iron transport system substrate-binding protein